MIFVTGMYVQAMGQVQEIIVRKPVTQCKLCGRWLLDRDSFYVKDTALSPTNDIFFDFYPDGKYYYKPNALRREYGSWKVSDGSLFTYDRKVYGNVKESVNFVLPMVKVFADSQSFELRGDKRLILKKGNTSMAFKKIKIK